MDDAIGSKQTRKQRKEESGLRGRIFIERQNRAKGDLTKLKEEGRRWEGGNIGNAVEKRRRKTKETKETKKNQKKNQKKKKCRWGERREVMNETDVVPWRLGLDLFCVLLQDGTS